MDEEQRSAFNEAIEPLAEYLATIISNQEVISAQLVQVTNDLRYMETVVQELQSRSNTTTALLNDQQMVLSRMEDELQAHSQVLADLPRQIQSVHDAVSNIRIYSQVPNNSGWW